MKPKPSSRQVAPGLIKRLINWLSVSSLDSTGDTTPVDTVQKDNRVVDESFLIVFDDQHTATAIRAQPNVPPGHALDALRLPPYEGVLVVHGGAGKMEDAYMDVVRQFLIESISPLAEKRRLLIIDGGTHAGTPQVLGDARDTTSGTYPLIGVVPECCVSYPGGPAPTADRAELNRAHSHFMLVQGTKFGDESELLVGLLQAAGWPGVAIAINGGEIVLEEIGRHAAEHNPIVTIAGSGRVADRLADPTSAERRTLPNHTSLHVAKVSDPQGCIDLLNRLLDQ